MESGNIKIHLKILFYFIKVIKKYLLCLQIEKYGNFRITVQLLHMPSEHCNVIKILTNLHY